MKSSHIPISLCSLLLQPSLSHAFWRMACGVAQTARIDPILRPGTVSGHVHKLAGGSNVNQNSDFNSLQSSSCSTCEVQVDKSAYWTPQLYYAHANGSFEEVVNYGMTVYYVGRGGNSSNTVPFPAGFKMITGDSTLRSYDSSTMTYLNTRPVADRVSFRCINAANDIPEQHYMFQTDCSNGLRAQVNFQSCWDGTNLYLENNAHVDYLSGIDYGVCPPSHPIPIPGLFFEVLYWTNLIDQSGGGQFTFSQGDTTGYGFHGDFLNGWDMDVQTAAVQDCLYPTSDDGVVSACPHLAPSDDVNVSRDCPQQPSVFDEPVSSLLTALPGCNPLTSGPAPAPQLVCPLNSHVPDGAVSVSPSGANTTVTASSAAATVSSNAVSVSATSLVSSTTSGSASASLPTTLVTVASSTSTASDTTSPSASSTSTSATESISASFFTSTVTSSDSLSIQNATATSGIFVPSSMSTPTTPISSTAAMTVISSHSDTIASIVTFSDPAIGGLPGSSSTSAPSTSPTSLPPVPDLVTVTIPASSAPSSSSTAIVTSNTQSPATATTLITVTMAAPSVFETPVAPSSSATTDPNDCSSSWSFWRPGCAWSRPGTAGHPYRARNVRS